MAKNYLEEIQFGDLPEYQQFVSGAGLFVKLSATMAVSVSMNRKYRFKKSAKVSLVKMLHYTSFTEGSSKASWDKTKCQAWAKKKFEERVS